MKLTEALKRYDRVHILVVDDEALQRDLFVKAMTMWGLIVDPCGSAEEAVPLLSSTSYDLVLLDIHLPGEDGTWLLSQLREQQPDAMVIMMTGDADIDTAIRSLTGGAHDFLLKPIDLQVLRAKLGAALETKMLRYERRHYLAQMEEMAAAERWKSHQTFLSAIDALIRALEAKDFYTKGHSARVAIIAEGIASCMNLKAHEVDEIVTAARCHDIGKIGVADNVLQKQGKLTNDEYLHIRRHATIGARILAPIFHAQPDVPRAVRHHHELYNGTGYPDGLANEEIPLGARIIAVADSYDAMTSNRIYRRALSGRDAVDEIIRNTGKQFCPQAVRGFMRFLAQLPEDMRAADDAWSDRRSEQRYEHTHPVNVAIAGNDSISAMSLDISRGGIRLETGEYLAAGETAELDMGSLGLVTGVVQWSRKSTESIGERRESGLRLTEAAEAYLKLVEQLAHDQYDRRFDRRIERLIPVNVFTELDVYKLTILNLSMEGAFIQSREVLPEGQPLTLSFALPDTDDLENLEIRARVVHSVTLKRATENASLIPGMGVEFTEFIGDARSRLHEYIITRILMLTREHKDPDDPGQLVN